ncbi:MAG TPA: hypothetical protein VFT65_03125 [Candidatus Angelobacter sp.]|nr:hypothetical protein [Candidatus Angelobacter sp.]
MFSAIILTMALAGFSALVSQEKNAPEQNKYTYDQANQERVHGQVVELRDFQCPVSGTMGSHITVRGEGGLIEVHMAPSSFIKQYEISIQKGDSVSVIGSRITYEGKPALIARSIVIGRDTYNFRDANGKPLW